MAALIGLCHEWSKWSCGLQKRKPKVVSAAWLLKYILKYRLAQTVAESISTRSIKKSDMASHKCLFRRMCTTKAAMTTLR